MFQKDLQSDRFGLRLEDSKRTGWKFKFPVITE